MFDLASATENFCYLTTTGRVTGQPHRVEIWFAAAPDTRTIYILSGGRERADWVRNLVAQPECTVEIGAETYKGTARAFELETVEDENGVYAAHKDGRRY